MGQYSKKGNYSGYDKNNKEREALDYYATPPQEVTNILNAIKPNFVAGDRILDPGCGGGHLIKGLLDYKFYDATVIGTDIKDRKNWFLQNLLQYQDFRKDIETTEGIAGIYTGHHLIFNYGKEYDFLLDSYPYDEVDYIIMNPPYNLLIPFIKQSLAIAKKGVLMLARLQFLEGQKRYEEILKQTPFTDMYVYVDRIACYKNGDFSTKPSSVQAYAWFYWDKTNPLKEGEEPRVHWLRRA